MFSIIPVNGMCNEICWFDSVVCGSRPNRLLHCCSKFDKKNCRQVNGTENVFLFKFATKSHVVCYKSVHRSRLYSVLSSSTLQAN